MDPEERALQAEFEARVEALDDDVRALATALPEASAGPLLDLLQRLRDCYVSERVGAVARGTMKMRERLAGLEGDATSDAGRAAWQRAAQGIASLADPRYAGRFYRGVSRSEEA